MADTSPQRAYKSACPGCGAPVEFRSAASTHAVCGYCSSTIVRSGDQLARIGKMAELFDDFSPLQLFATGVYESRAFTIIGRLQYAYKDGGWSEWYCSFDGADDADTAANTGWLSEDNGQYVFVRSLAIPKAPELSSLRLGMGTAIQGKRFQVTAITRVHLSGAQGELPKMPPLNREFGVVEMRADDGAVLTLDYADAGDSGSPSTARAYTGFGVSLNGLQLQGLRDTSDKAEKTARQFDCPNCGAPVALKLENTQTVTCASCTSVIDTSKGIGNEVVTAIQDEPVKPLIALGTIGTLSSVKWQVVGFQHRIGREPGDDEQFGWDEYLLFNRTEGFAFVVDASDGWSFVRPLSGAPDHKAGSSVAKYLGKSYSVKTSYDAETTYVAGEFYWRSTRGARTSNVDFSQGQIVLSREQSVEAGAQEVTWSRGTQLDADAVAKAFNLKGREGDLARDVAPLGSGMSVKTLIVLFVVFMIVAMLISTCSSRDRNCDPQRENCNNTNYRSGTSGGSYGGWSGGGSGGHK